MTGYGNGDAPCRIVRTTGEIMDGTVGLVYREDGVEIPIPLICGFSATFEYDHSTATGVAVYLERAPQ